MELAIPSQENLFSNPFVECGQYIAHVRDELDSSIKRLAFDPVESNTSSVTAPLKSMDTSGFNPISINPWSLKSDHRQVTTTTDAWLSSSYKDVSISLSSLISFVRNHVRLGYSEALASRLSYLHEASIDEAPDQAPISVDSLQCFISFIDGKTELKEPDVVLTYSGNIRAEWYRSRKEHLGVEFLPTGQVRYVVFARDPNHSTRIDRSSGWVAAESLMEKISPFNVLAWVAI